MLSRVIDSNESKNLLAKVCMLKVLNDFLQKNLFLMATFLTPYQIIYKYITQLTNHHKISNAHLYTMLTCRISLVVRHLTCPSTLMRLWLMVLQCKQPSWAGIRAHRSRMCCLLMWHPCPLALRLLVVSWQRLWSAIHVSHASRPRPLPHIPTISQQLPYRSVQHRLLEPFWRAK